MRLRRTALSIAVVAACAFAAASPWARQLGSSGTDILFWLRSVFVAPAEPAPDHVAIIAIDERSFRTAPFQGVPRVLWAPQIADVMTAVLAAGPSTVGWDIVFPTSAAEFLADNRHDLALLKQLVAERDTGRVVLGAAQLGDEPIVPFERMRWAAGHSRNIRSLNLHTDPDGVVRAVPLFMDRQTPDGTVREPAFALELAARHLGIRPGEDGMAPARLGEFAFPADAGNALRLNYVGAPGMLPTYSFADLWHCALENRADYFRDAFAGRVVLFGTVLDVEDRVVSSGRLITRPDGEGWPAPCTSNLTRRDTSALIARNTVPGVYLQAAAINNMLERNPLRPMGFPLRLAVIVIVTALIAVAVRHLHPVAAGAVAIGVGLAWVVTATALLVNTIEAPLVEPLASGAVAFAILFAYRVAVIDRDKRHIRRAFSYYVAPSLLDRMVESGSLPALGGEERDITVLFSDIANFTPLAEDTGPQELVGILNAYFAGVTEIIEAHLGFVEHYLGDGVLALFGAPVDDPDHRANATRAALELQAHIERLRGTIALPAGHVLASRIGINSGRMVVGNVGSKTRFNYTVIGDAVNLAARLEGTNKVYGTQIIVSDSTAQGTGAQIVLRELDTIRVVGRAQPVRIFEPVGLKDRIGPDDRAVVDAYEAGLRAYRAREFAAAASILEPLAGKDNAASVLAARADHFAANPPAPDWDGVFSLEAK